MQITRGIKPEYNDERGGITPVLSGGNAPIKSVLYITSQAGTVRSNHYHKKDTHYCYIMSGKAEWYEQPVGGGPLEKEILEAGDMVYTPAMMVHAVKFLEDTVFIAFSTESRLQENYEADTVRVKLI